MQKNRGLLFGTFVLLLLALSACGGRHYFDQTKDLPQPWKSGEKTSFIVDVNDSITPFDFYINIRNATDYSYSNFFFFLKTYFPDGRYSVDTVNIWLADKDGKWIGKGFGQYRDQAILFRKYGRFPMTGKYRFEMEQAMREEELYGIHSIGINIEYSDTKEN